MLRTALRHLARSATLVALALAGTSVLAQSADAPDSLFDHSLRRLHADEVVQLAERYAPIPVTGEAAHPIFREIARQSSAPEWNFHKYVIDRNGRVVAAFPSEVKPDAPEVIAAIEKVL